jgi:hypothetical protein
MKCPYNVKSITCQCGATSVYAETAPNYCATCGKQFEPKVGSVEWAYKMLLEGNLLTSTDICRYYWIKVNEYIYRKYKGTNTVAEIFSLRGFIVIHVDGWQLYEPPYKFDPDCSVVLDDDPNLLRKALEMCIECLFPLCFVHGFNKDYGTVDYWLEQAGK